MHEDKKEAGGGYVLQVLRGYIARPESRARAVHAPRGRLEELWRNAPKLPGGLLRYKVSFERAFDRTLAQLQRFQRMRLDLPVPHRADVRLRCHRDDPIAASRFRRI